MRGSEKRRGCASGLAWRRKGPCPGSPLSVAADGLVISQKPHSFPAAELFHSENYEMSSVTSQFYVSVTSARFPWHPDLLDNLNINDSDQAAIQGAQKSEGRLEARGPRKANDPAP